MTFHQIFRDKSPRMVFFFWIWSYSWCWNQTKYHPFELTTCCYVCKCMWKVMSAPDMLIVASRRRKMKNMNILHSNLLKLMLNYLYAITASLMQEKPDFIKKQTKNFTYLLRISEFKSIMAETIFTIFVSLWFLNISFLIHDSPKLLEQRAVWTLVKYNPIPE